MEVIEQPKRKGICFEWAIFSWVIMIMAIYIFLDTVCLMGCNGNIIFFDIFNGLKRQYPFWICLMGYNGNIMGYFKDIGSF